MNVVITSLEDSKSEKTIIVKLNVMQSSMKHKPEIWLVYQFLLMIDSINDNHMSYGCLLIMEWVIIQSNMLLD